MRGIGRAGRVLLVIAAAVASICQAAAQAGAVPERITMIKGTTRSISLPFKLSKIAIGSPSVADYRVDKSQTEVILNARGIGSTNLLVWNESGRKLSIKIDVVANLDRLANNLRALFRDVEGVQVSVAGNRVLVDGAVFSESDYSFVKANAGASPDLILFRVRLNPDALRLLASEVEKAIGREEVRARVVKDKILLEGKVYSQAEADRAIAIATTFSKDRVIPALDVVSGGSRFRTNKQVHLDIKVMKVFNEDLSRLGIKWPSQIGNVNADDGSVEFEMDDTSANVDTLPGKFFQNVEPGKIYWRFFGTLTNLIPTLNLLVQDGGGTIMGNPRLVVQAGETAKETVAGGEYPVVTGSAIAGYQVEYKDFGFLVEATPRVSDRDDVDLSIKVTSLQFLSEVSSFNLPLFSKDAIDTRVNIPKGDSLVIAGVIANSLRQKWERLPGLGRIPVLNYLFGSKQKNLDQAEVVIFVTPTTLDPGRGVTTDRELLDRVSLKIQSEPKFSRALSGS